MANDVVVSTLGMATAVGLSSVQTAASVRAGVPRIKELPWFNRAKEPFVMACLTEDALPELAPEIQAMSDLTIRETRLLRLAHLALDEAVKPLANLQTSLPLAVGLPDTETGLPFRADQFVKLLALQTGKKIDVPTSKIIRKGRAAGILAMKEAIAILDSGKAQLVLAGGVDSYRDMHLLGTLDRDGRINSSENLDGLIPGEGAGFLLLTKAPTAQQRKLPILVRVRALRTGFEEGHWGSQSPYRGDGLAALFQELFAEAGQCSPIHDIFSSMNGENYWGKEWGVGYLRNKKFFADPFQIFHPADCYGDAGAGCAPLLAGLATRYLQQGLIQSPALVYGSSDFGDRGALLLEKIETGRP